MKEEHVEYEIRCEMTNERVGNTSIIKCFIYFQHFLFLKLLKIV